MATWRHWRSMRPTRFPHATRLQEDNNNNNLGTERTTPTTRTCNNKEEKKKKSKSLQQRMRTPPTTTTKWPWHRNTATEVLLRWVPWPNESSMGVLVLSSMCRYTHTEQKQPTQIWWTSLHIFCTTQRCLRLWPLHPVLRPNNTHSCVQNAWLVGYEIFITQRYHFLPMTRRNQETLLMSKVTIWFERGNYIYWKNVCLFTFCNRLSIYTIFKFSEQVKLRKKSVVLYSFVKVTIL